MKRGRHSYEHGTLNEILYSFSEYGGWTTMEIINFKGLRLTCHLAFMVERKIMLFYKVVWVYCGVFWFGIVKS